MKETLKHTQAFEYYYSLGEKRSLPQVARKFTISETSVKKWSQAFSWQDKLQCRDERVAYELEKKNIAKIVEDKTKILDTIRALFNQFELGLKPERVVKIKDSDGIEKEVYAPKVEVSKISDYTKLVKTYLMLTENIKSIPSMPTSKYSMEDMRKKLFAKIEAISGRFEFYKNEETQADQIDSKQISNE
jgi:hypothetical protein